MRIAPLQGQEAELPHGQAEIFQLLDVEAAVLGAGAEVAGAQLPDDVAALEVVGRQATLAGVVGEAAERRAKAARPTYNLTGYPPAVREGYIDGCESAKGTEFARKDAQRFTADPQYSMGWNDGFSICGKR